MKTSLYNNCRPAEGPGRALAFNSFSGALIEVSAEQANFLAAQHSFDPSQLRAKDAELLEDLYRNGFVVDDDVDEFNLLKRRHDRAKHSRHQLDITISPTLDCNFGCFYCYQGRTKERMSQQVQDEIINFIAQHKGLEELKLSWFGGEPLLCLDIIESMSERIDALSRKMGFTYSAQMTTNGFDLDRERVAILRKCHVNNFQITLDGPPDLHDKRRNLVTRSNGTFWQIVEGIKLLNEAGATVIIRSNVDKTNIERVEELIDILDQEGLQQNSFYLGQVKPYSEKVKRVSKVFLSKAEMGQYDARVQKYLAQKNFRAKADVHFPEPKNTYCSANRTHAYVIDHDGETYKCWAEIGDHSLSLGQLRDLPPPELAEEKASPCAQRWHQWTPFDEAKGCATCKMLPICMGGCAFSGMTILNNVPECIKFKFNLEETLVKKAAQLRGIKKQANAVGAEA
jgi:uncharacterized protein